MTCVAMSSNGSRIASTTATEALRRDLAVGLPTAAKTSNRGCRVCAELNSFQWVSGFVYGWLRWEVRLGNVG